MAEVSQLVPSQAMGEQAWQTLAARGGGMLACPPPGRVPDLWQRRKLGYCLLSRRNSCLGLFLPVFRRPSLSVESPAGS